MEAQIPVPEAACSQSQASTGWVQCQGGGRVFPTRGGYIPGGVPPCFFFMPGVAAPPLVDSVSEKGVTASGMAIRCP